MQRRGLIAFVVFNIIVTAGVAFLVVSSNPGGAGSGTERLVTFVVRVTTTPDPNFTPPVIVVTATPDPNNPNPSQPQVDLPPDIIETNPAIANAPTIDPAVLDENPAIAEAQAALPPNCFLHIVQEGEFPTLIAENYGVNFFDLMAVNNLDEESATQLQIGDQLIVPAEGCELLAQLEAEVVSSEDDAGDEAEVTQEVTSEVTPEITAEATPELSPTPTVSPTITLAPTAANAQVEITQIIGPGDITTEAVVIRNVGNTLNLSGWTLSDGDGNTFVFPDERRLFSNASLTINTRTGQNTPVVLFWGRDEAVFGEEGDVIILADADGEVQATLRRPTLDDE